LHVAVRANGSLEMVKVLRSSGKKILDDAAVRSVKLAAPYAAFPADIRADIDILDITRTFQFRRGSQRVQ
jgi:protein TonB